jgi:hypothetical protein
MNVDGKPYIPPTCPAIGYEIGTPPLRGFVAEPESFYVLMSVEQGGTEVYTVGEFALDRLGGVWARAIKDTRNLRDFDESETMQRLNDEVHIERRLGEKFCERIKNCAGALMRDGVPICSALDPAVLPEVIAEIPKE